MTNGEETLLSNLKALRIFEVSGKKFSTESGAQVSELGVDNGWRQGYFLPQ